MAHLFALRQQRSDPDVQAIAHDLNNLLTAISGYAGLLAGDDSASAEVKRDAAEIVEAAARAVALVRRLRGDADVAPGL